jgi:hypothetical protein
MDLEAIVEDTEAKITNAAASTNNVTTNPYPAESESTINNDDLHLEVEGHTNTSMVEANPTSHYHCDPIGIDEDAMAKDLRCSLDDDEKEEDDDVSMNGFKILGI